MSGETSLRNSICTQKCKAASLHFMTSAWLDNAKRFGGNTMQPLRKCFSLFATDGDRHNMVLRSASAYKKGPKATTKSGTGTPLRHRLPHKARPGRKATRVPGRHYQAICTGQSAGWREEY